VIDGKEKTSFIPNTIKYETFVKTNDIKTSLDNNIDLKETYIARNPGKKIRMLLQRKKTCMLLT
jgi:hypothetical protein